MVEKEYKENNRLRDAQEKYKCKTGGNDKNSPRLEKGIQ